ncbi:hypothetical protein cypCar_00001297 [Cyprinus carpio]|nr:hypothetical protein cypCar_00001297 [Cyprinus carpio]
MLGSDVLLCFIFYSTLLILKMYIIAIITGQVRLRKKSHTLNDMENIFPFLFLGAIYSMTGPSYAVAQLHFLVFFLGRVLHSVAYLLALKAPTRSFAYVIAQVPCVSMAIQIIMEVASFA